ncbi:MAG TPA: type IV toxin-antitoxin system AbiEi family antitoxin domain-containing protein [Candidatus Izemoplasmatales bacterium]|nr:type IV toxin-antitoxin system AbiEi family antitoxin domain-containing protein [Bacillota bacterium]HRY78498.1 type IV toxin-antitoxin system AbiEi family antitoxin domain-containing protein [Candidatus Izemoplasmatales bacterium]
MKKNNSSTPMENRPFLKVKELRESGLSPYKIRKMEAEGKIQKITRKTYQNMDFDGEESDFLQVSAYVPNGVIGLMTAAVFHGMSTFRPKSIDVCVLQKSRVWTLPDWPPISLYYFSKNRYETGAQTVKIPNGDFVIYDPEKTVCDVLFYRHKIGIESSLEVLKKYLRREDRNLNKLIEYSHQLRCYQVLKTYLEGIL